MSLGKSSASVLIVDESSPHQYNTASFIAAVAQLVERIHGKDEVRGSIPRGGSNKQKSECPTGLSLRALLRGIEAIRRSNL